MTPAATDDDAAAIRRRLAVAERAVRRAAVERDLALVGVGRADRDGRLLDANRTMCTILGRDGAQLRGCTLADLTPDDGPDRDLASTLCAPPAGTAPLCEEVALPEDSALPGAPHEPTRTAELRVLRPDGSTVWIAVTADLVDDGEGDGHWLQQITDVTDRRRVAREREELARRDPLTGLANRGLLGERLGVALRAARRDDSAVAVVLVDVDRFKVVNDSLGHPAGDALLVELAVRLSDASPGCTVARLAGDEFAVVLTDLVSEPEALERAGRLLAATNGTYEIAGRRVHVTASAGVAVSSSSTAAALTTAEGLLRNAGLAVQRSKASGGGHAVTFESSDLEAVRERLELETDVRAALDGRMITVAYQPVVRTADHTIVGAEALARWDHPRLGNLPAAELLHLAASVGLLAQLTGQVLDAACTQVAGWQAAGTVAPDFRVAVNLSADDVVDPRLVDVVRHALAVSGLDPTSLSLEVTETGLVRDVDAALACLTAIRRLGVRFAVDDFGTGFSSLSYLKLFPVDAVKIDKSFVRGLGRDADATALVRGILSLTRALGLTAVAEGIENDVELEALRQLGCPLAQGYFWCPPVPPEQFPTVVGPDRAAPGRPSAPLLPSAHAPQLSQHLGWAVLDSLPTAVTVIDTDGNILATNLPWQRHALDNGGDAASCGVGTNYLAVCDNARGPGAEDAALAARGLRAVLAGDRNAFSIEYDFGDDFGANRYLMLVSPLVAGSGAAVVTHLDITDRHAAELALAESEERFRSIFDQAPLGILRLDTAGRIADANPALCALVGRPAEELHGQPRAALFDESDPGDVGPAPDGRSLQSRRRFRRPDGELRVGQVNDVVVRDKAGELHALVATVEDVTEELRLNEELRRSQELESLGRLAAGIAHEINTPTQFISDNLTFLADIWQGLSGLLEACGESPGRLRGGDRPDDVATRLEGAAADADLDFARLEVPSALAQSQEGVARVAGIVRAMKAFGHPDHDQPELADLNRLVADTVTVANSELKYVADVEVDLGDVPAISCYPGAVGQVVLNLLVNAAHAVDGRGSGAVADGRRGRITVRTWADGEDACLSVSDTGGGIPAHVLPHIFEPFFTTKPVGQGTGQGLALAWTTIVDRHRGHLDVTTSERGACFTVTLPLRRQTTATGSRAPGAVLAEVVSGD